MRVPLSWLREHVALPEGETGRAVADRLLRAGLEVETVERIGDLSGPVVVGRVLDFADEPQKNGKTIRWCQVDVGTDEPRGIVCGAANFRVGDLVVVALPGSVLSGGFAITARTTYGHVSDGMICSTRELGIGDEHDGILVLAPDLTAEPAKPGADATAVLGLGDEVLDIAVTPDRGYALSIRGIAREAATAYDLGFSDPVDLDVPAPDGAGHPVEILDPGGCDVFVARSVHGFDPAAPSPQWLQRRVAMAGMRPVSLAVDVTNYVMLELGQPLHAYDADRLDGPIVVRRAAAAEVLRTLDGTERRLDPDDLLITDASGPIGVAGVMGGASTEISEHTRSILIEAAHFEPTSIARSARRHKLASEASRRFERGVDPGVATAAAQRAVDLLTSLGGGTGERGITVVGAPSSPESIEIECDLFGRVVGWASAPTEGCIEAYLQAVGCFIQPVPPALLRVTPATWRPDLTDPYDLVEEVARLHGYDTIPSVLPVAPAGRGLTSGQRLRRAAERAVAAAGYVEAPSYPFVGDASWDAFGLEAEDPWRHTVTLANPLSEQEPGLRTTLLPGLLRALARNVGRGQTDVALFEVGLVFHPRPDAPGRAPRLGVDRRPSPAEIAALEEALPDQPRHLGVVLAGWREPKGWWGEGHQAGWADAVEAARTAARAVRAELSVRSGSRPPWHPGRCAELVLGTSVVGWAGELHPRVVAALDLPARTCAAEVDLDALIGAAGAPVPAPTVSTYPVATQDVALVLDDTVPSAEVESALRAGAGELLESLRLFDVYTDTALGEGKRSLAYNLRFRAADRTLTAEEAGAARNAAVAEASRRTGATLRGT
jgi:phenylalanyl-tRNA synthetase beta chain